MVCWLSQLSTWDTSDQTSLRNICRPSTDIRLDKFRFILSSPADPELADARFALAAILAVSSMARSCAGIDYTVLDVNAIAEQFILTRSVRDMILLSSEHIRTGPLAALLQIRRCPKPSSTRLPSSVSIRFEAIKHMLATYGMDSNAHQHCQTALLELREMYKNIAHILYTENVELGDISRCQIGLDGIHHTDPSAQSTSTCHPGALRGCNDSSPYNVVHAGLGRARAQLFVGWHDAILGRLAHRTSPRSATCVETQIAD